MRLASSVFLSALILVLPLPACGDKGEDSDATATDTVDPSEGSDPSTGTPTTGGPTTASSDASSDSGDACGDFGDEEVGPAVAISIRNAGAAPAFVDLTTYCYFSVPYTLLDMNDAPVPWVGPDCGTCQAHVDAACFCPGAPCFAQALLYLEPGAVWTGAWGGGQYASETLPDVCVAHGQCESACLRHVQAPAGGYTLRSEVSDAAQGCMPEPCACTPGPEGFCFIEGLEGELAGAPQTITAAFTYPDEAAVELVIP